MTDFIHVWYSDLVLEVWSVQSTNWPCVLRESRYSRLIKLHFMLIPKVTFVWPGVNTCFLLVTKVGDLFPRTCLISGYPHVWAFPYMLVYTCISNWICISQSCVYWCDPLGFIMTDWTQNCMYMYIYTNICIHMKLFKLCQNDHENWYRRQCHRKPYM